MDNVRVEDDHHISRYCGFEKISQVTGMPLGIAFQLKPEELYLSVNWLEYLKQPTRAEEIESVRQAFRNKGFGLGAKAIFAVLNVGAMRSRVSVGTNGRRDAQVLHQPSHPHDLSHSGIFDTRDEEALIMDLIAEAVLETHGARK